MADVTSAPDASAGTAQTAQSPQPTSNQTQAPQSTTSSTGSTTSAPVSTQASESGKQFNLQESPEFKKWQAQVNKTIERERQQYQQQLAAMQQQMQQFRLQSAPEEERIAIERDMLRQQLAQTQQEQQRQAQLAQQWNDIQRLAEKSGLKAEDLWSQNFSNIGDAAFYALEYMANNSKTEFEKAVDAEIERRAKQREANKVDLGGGAIQTSVDAATEKINSAFKSKDVRGFMKAIREQRQGV